MKDWLLRELGLKTGNEAEDEMAKAGLLLLVVGFGALAVAGYVVHALVQFLPPL